MVPKQTDGPRMEVKPKRVTIWLAGELPSLRKPSGMNFRKSRSNIGAKIRAAEKRDIQQTWYTKLLALGAHHEIRRMQRVCAKAGKLLNCEAVVSRRNDLDYKNLVTAVDEILIDPLQRGDEPILYTDSPKNLALFVAAGVLVPDVFAGQPHVSLSFSVSMHPCAESIVRRYVRETQGGRKGHGRPARTRA